MWRSVLVVILCALCGVVAAEDSDGRFAVKGAGLLPCKVYVVQREQRSQVYYLVAGWLEGYVTAHNRYADDTYDVTSFESLELLLLLIDSHCKSKPDDRLYPVVNSILANLAPNRLKASSEHVEITVGEQRTVLYAETVQRIQLALTRHGLLEPPADGQYSGATRAALAAFQQQAGLEPSGFPDQTTLWRLLRR